MKAQGRAASRFEALLVRWRRRRTGSAVLEGLGVTALLTAAGFVVGVGRGAVVGASAGALLTALWMWSHWREKAFDRALLAQHLDRTLSSLQDSGELLAAAAPNPPLLLERLQRERARIALAQAQGDPLPRRRFRMAARFAGLAAAASLVAAFAGQRQTLATGSPAAAPSAAAPSLAPRIEGATLTVRPPSYTGNPSRALIGLEGSVEAGASVEWRVTTSGGVAAVELVWVDGVTPLRPDAGAAHRWTGARAITTSQIYSIRATGSNRFETRSPYARLTVIADEPPTVRITEPEEPLIERAAEAVGALDLTIEARDDYGVARADLVATLASGSGEGVTFDETRLELAGGGPRFAIRLDLAAKGLAPGSELYLFAEVRDRRRPEPNVGRSQPLRVRIGDPAAPSSALGRGVVLGRPEDSFRSQRQIIIDTERLVADAARLERNVFEQRSQDLGFDQMALRLRYGALLGEESEFGDGEAEPDEGPGAGSSSPSTAPLAGLPDGLVHFHDSIESATYFSDPLRREMKRMLGVMWQAEGRLRIFDPRGALPHELEALRILKEIQRRSRAYVPKTAGAQPKVLMERRLTGDLSKVRDTSRTVAAPPRPPVQTERALDALREARRNDPDALLAGLDQAAAVLAKAATDERLVDLDALDAVGAAQEARRAGAEIDPAIWARIESGLWLATAPPGAGPTVSAAEDALLRRYRQALAAAPETDSERR